MDLSEFGGIAVLVVMVWMYGFGTAFVQGLDKSIPEIELNAMRILGKFACGPGIQGHIHTLCNSATPLPISLLENLCIPRNVYKSKVCFCFGRGVAL